jgi:WD40 repeat protein
MDFIDSSMAGHSGWVESLVVLPNGDPASGSNDGTIKIWR